MGKLKEFVLRVVVLASLVTIGGLSLYGCSLSPQDVVNVLEGIPLPPEPENVADQKQPAPTAPLPNLPLPGK